MEIYTRLFLEIEAFAGTRVGRENYELPYSRNGINLFDLYVLSFSQYFLHTDKYQQIKSEHYIIAALLSGTYEGIIYFYHPSYKQ